MTRYFKVEEILDKKIKNGDVKYLVKWAGWEVQDSTWEPLLNLSNVKGMVEDFERKETRLREKKQTEEAPKKFIKKAAKPMQSNGKSLTNSAQSEIKKSKSKKEKFVVEEVISIDEDNEGNNIPGNIDCDIPNKIISAKLTENNDVICLIDWKIRYDGTQPLVSFVSNKILKVRYPLLLLEYYESKIR